MATMVDAARPVRAAAAGSAPREREAAGDDEKGFFDSPVRTGLVIGAGAVALAGVAILKRPVQSKVVDVIDGVELLSNPRLPRGVRRGSWQEPPTGTVFGPAPGARVSIEHVDQGALGDCWNIAGHGAIAHRRPQVFEQMVRPSGEHVIVHLPERSVAVTKELPVGPKGPLFGGSGADDPVFWPAYVEKAQAAVASNGYRSLEGGFTKDAFRQLLGTNPVKVPSRGSILDDVAHHVRAKQPVAISTLPPTQIGSATKARMAELNIKPNHYYVPTEVTGQGDEAVVRLFNPWGAKHPTEPVGLADLRRIFDGLDTPDEYVRYGTRG